jgi:hypothetical protein
VPRIAAARFSGTHDFPSFSDEDPAVTNRGGAIA